MELINREYNRQKCYYYIIKKISVLLNIHNKRQLYEHKNIIERFVLEMINDGIMTDSLGSWLFFNDKLASANVLLNEPIFIKLLGEYSEKKIHVPEIMKERIAQIITSSHYYFLNSRQATDGIPQCKIKIYSNHVILRYQEYYKYLSKTRYKMLDKGETTSFALFKMIMRYSLFDNSGQQWSIGDNIYSLMIDDFKIGLEMFASPLNYTIPKYCSLFLDTDEAFGSIGSFFNLTSEILISSGIHGALFNPPYLPLLMNRATSKLLSIMSECVEADHELNIVAFLPAWYDSYFMTALNESPYLVCNRLIRRGEYYLKQRHDDSVMISNFDISLVVLNTRNLENEQRCEKIGKIKNVVDTMRSEITTDRRETPFQSS